ncbi:uncharacterized protein LOC120654253 [Panicum virgatum]|uniref:uncharacterized protein LOC120654253 n=1 Tax=Panicum virgatum TaxID=38727 RepID=UPI0019D51AF8|nr:uncharacterized protein LOC120654253 [Panicum virgatum]
MPPRIAAMATAASALVEPLPPPHPEPNQPRSRLHLAPRKLTDLFLAAHDRRNAAAAAQYHCRTPAAVEPPPRTTSSRSKATYRIVAEDVVSELVVKSRTNNTGPGKSS